MKNTIKHIKEALKKAYTYKDYQDLIEKLLQEGKSTTKDAGEDFVHYSELGIQRMKRWDKKFELDADQLKRVKAVTQNQTWIVLAEGWCGDAAHIVPIMNKIAKANPHIELKVVLREENPDLMNEFLTNGSKSIPKLAIYDSENEKVLNSWGPRPEGAKLIFEKYRDEGFEVMEPKLQAWYNKDKGESTAAELVGLLK